MALFTCTVSVNAPLVDLRTYNQQHVHQNEKLFWYIGKASLGLKQDGNCRSNQRSIDSYREHLPIGDEHKRRNTYHKILTERTVHSFSYFYPNQSESVNFLSITNNIDNSKIIKLNINMCNGIAVDNCYLHLYVCSRDGNYQLHFD